MILFFVIGLLLILGLLVLVSLLKQSRSQQQASALKLQVDYCIQSLNTSFARLEERSIYHQEMVNSVNRLLSEQQSMQQQERVRLDEHQLNTLKTLQESLQTSMLDVRNQVTEALNQHANRLSQRVEHLTTSTDQHLKEISGQVERRLSEGFEKTTATFTDVVKRLALIDEAQKKITELSANVVSLQAVFTDKRARGAFGEVQLADLIRNVLPEKYYALQQTLSNGKRVDCLLKLPEPTGNIAIDAKFPLENYRQMLDISLTDQERQPYEQRFRKDIQKHIADISEKYILPGETADSALMFIPAEAIFAEIHAHYPDLVELAQRAHVWIVSPTTMWAILTTARAVIKDVAMRKQVHIVQQHLHGLSEDFNRFKARMDNLAKHIRQAHEDTQEVHTTSKKISAHFSRIEKVELTDEKVPLLIPVEKEGLLTIR
jgi:DNA recombination protein RmuC